MSPIELISKNIPFMSPESNIPMNIKNKKPFLVYWQNDCGYGVEKCSSPEEQEKTLTEIKRMGTKAWLGHEDDTKKQH